MRQLHLEKAVHCSSLRAFEKGTKRKTEKRRGEGVRCPRPDCSDWPVSRSNFTVVRRATTAKAAGMETRDSSKRRTLGKHRDRQSAPWPEDAPAPAFLLSASHIRQMKVLARISPITSSYFFKRIDE